MAHGFPLLCAVDSHSAGLEATSSVAFPQVCLFDSPVEGTREGSDYFNSLEQIGIEHGMFTV